MKADKRARGVEKKPAPDFASVELSLAFSELSASRAEELLFLFQALKRAI